MKQSRAIRPVHLVGVVLTVGLACLIAWIVIGNTDDSPDFQGRSSTEGPTQTESKSGLLDDRSAALAPAAARFIETYLYRDASLTEDDLRRRLTPLVTPSFLEQHPPDLSTESDEWVRQNDGVIEATATVPASDAGIESETTALHVEITVTGKAIGQVEPPYTFSVWLTLTWADGWKVADIG